MNNAQARADLLAALPPLVMADASPLSKVARRAAAEVVARGLPAPARTKFAMLLAERVAAYCAALGAETVALYAPIGAEVDTRPLANRLLVDGLALAYPRLLAEPGQMDLAASAGPSALRSRPRSRILEPQGAALPPAAFDVVVVPALGFDGALRRLGRGGGYYDRYLPQLRADALIVLVAPSAAAFAFAPIQPHDVSGHLVVTERGAFGPAATQG